MMQHKDLLILSIFTFVTVFVWIVSDVYHAVVTSQITEVQTQLMIPLNPKINQFAIDSMYSRQQQ